MDYIWVALAFALGFLANQIKLPPLVGYLAAGFGLHALGVTPDDSLEELSDLGVTLLLFTIGLKLNVRNLLKPEIWGSALGHMGTIIGLTIVNSLFLGYLGLIYFEGLNWLGATLIGFAVSFSSTVCAVKVLEERGELGSRHGNIAIGILIIQDIAAVMFVTLTADTLPTLWALGLLALPLVRPFLIKLLNKCGHGELLPLAGFFLAFSSGELFELVGLKAQLGALVIGILLSNDKKGKELARDLMHFKDIFLIAFFLSIGFTALPTAEMMGVAAIMALALPIKSALFYAWLIKFRVRNRSSFLASLSLTNYSEFGLIVCAASVASGFIAQEWLVIMALVLALSFVFSSILNAFAHVLFIKWRKTLKPYESPTPLPEDSFTSPGDVKILVIGMGRVGTGAYEVLDETHRNQVCGVEESRQKVSQHNKEGRNVIHADAEDPNFWEFMNIKSVEMVMLAIPNTLDILEIVNQLHMAEYKGKIAGVIKYEDDEEKLLDAGVDLVFNFYQNAGAGFADQATKIIEGNK